MNKLFTFFALLLCLQLQAQERIDGTLEFQTDPAKKYSIFIPTEYDENVPNKMMLALHPWNTNRWDAQSWCDTLIAFADANDLLLICPDGGEDGQVDDPIDTAFTTLMLQNMEEWYNVNPEEVYIMGFSWGGRTTYSYGMRRAEKFAGFLPIGAAIEGTNQVTGFLQNAEDKPFYLVHGNNDSPSVRFTPMLNALEDNDACTESNLMPGIGHTIDFPNRNAILSEAFQWIETAACGETSAVNNAEEVQGFLSPNPIQAGQQLSIRDWKEIEIYDLKGEKVNLKKENNSFATSGLSKGLYIVTGTFNGKKVSEKLVVL